MYWGKKIELQELAVNQQVALSSDLSRKIFDALDNFHDSVLDFASLDKYFLMVQISSPYSYILRKYVETIVYFRLQLIENVPEELLPRSDVIIAGISISEDNSPKFTLSLDDGSDLEFLVNLAQCSLIIQVPLTDFGIM